MTAAPQVFSVYYWKQKRLSLWQRAYKLARSSGVWVWCDFALACNPWSACASVHRRLNARRPDIASSRLRAMPLWTDKGPEAVK